MISKNKQLLVSVPLEFEKIPMSDHNRELLLSTPLSFIENIVRITSDEGIRFPISETNIVVELQKYKTNPRLLQIFVNDTEEKDGQGRLEIPHYILPFGAMTIRELGKQFSHFRKKDENRKNMDIFDQFLQDGGHKERFFCRLPKPGEKLKVFKENQIDDGFVVNKEKTSSSLIGFPYTVAANVEFGREHIVFKIKKGESFRSILLLPDYCRSITRSGMEKRLNILLEMVPSDSLRYENRYFGFLEKFEKTIGPIPDEKLSMFLPVFFKACQNLNSPALYVGELSGRKHLFYQEAGTDSEISVIASQFDKGKESQQLLEFFGKLILSKKFSETPLSRFVPGLDSRDEER